MWKDFCTAGESMRTVNMKVKIFSRQGDPFILTLSGFQFTADSSDSVLVAGEAGTCNSNNINDLR